MRRVLGPLVPLLLLVGLLATPVAAFADDGGDLGATIVLAADADAEPQGPTPAPRTQEENPARTLAGYEDRETQFTWGAAWILLVAGAFGVTLLGGLYYLLVERPSRQSAGRR
ncbi:hypothetical protein [Egicoccus halophilus]|uniref:Cobalt/nickel transport protein n=1 Tax=Egicoccus halophilus TaxID=1670830 RepID=A0A8J3AGF3_9ACTN|nr:hypothetical protein [Egicoccus halophilus]GGI07748.1 hypothetical protein GCM10011354_25640 [Egicoccus halophilus]